MPLFILRHGHAHSHAPRDELRDLSDQGRNEIRASLGARKSELADVKGMWVSPYRRAQQSADTVIEVLGDVPRTTSSLIVPEGRPTDVIQALYASVFANSHPDWLLVSHQPFVSSLIENLCGLETGMVTMGTASLAALDVDVLASGCCTLRWVQHATV